MDDSYSGGYSGGYSSARPNNSPYALAIKIADGFCLAVLALILSWSMFALPSDPWAKTWACGSALFADVALLLTVYSAFATNGNWLSTTLHVCLFANCVLWSLNFETAAETCSATPMSWICQGQARYAFYSFLYWHLMFDPHASSAGSGQPPCCGPRRQNNMSSGMGMGGGGGGGGQNGYDNSYELGREYTRRSKRSRRRRLADVEAFGSSEDKDVPHGLARSQSAGYGSLGRRGSRSSRRLSSDSLDQL
ncbi:hypothetical protein C6P46_002132 [Rhodotorula mucilaginosa]|uniref:Uncharacterized protein n=1 Tax=Rhodotorula mucilaginosa TaxID=5537 RepID=A0A9P7B7B3_RHOMI|nr:hypothetical protein C6P46_002132 [Rhodotorula mucilaginosa]